MSITLRQLARPLAILPPCTIARLVGTYTTKAAPASPVETDENAAGKPLSSEVAPVSESKDVPVAAEIISGAPVELRHRLIRIFQPTRNTMQSGGAKGEKWRIDWDALQGAGMWQNPLMGWGSSYVSVHHLSANVNGVVIVSADYMQGTRISFNTREDAIRFAEKQGWDYYVQPATVKRVPPKNYSENYVYKPNKLRIARTK
ncbi:NADH-ubiquinone oxidoreductase 21kDa subunit [Gautieria morchelliformis]|nr:NADH-ubiquinone oxidoreductase 21kDa subunit [Gautieria morchelliformis]